MACVVDPCMPWDVLASGNGAADPAAAPAASSAKTAASCAKAAASCCRALSDASGRAAPDGVAARRQALAPPAVLARASHRALEISSEAVHQGISQALLVLQEAGGAAEAAQDERPQGCEVDPRAAEALASGSRLIASLLEEDVPAEIVACLGCLCFEARKDAMRLFTDILKYAPPLGAEKSLTEYFLDRPRILQFLLEGCAHSSVFAHCAQMLRACTRHPELVAALLHGGAALRLIELARSPNFEISTEAFATLKEILLAQNAVSAPILAADFEEFFPSFSSLLGTGMDYVVRRQALRLLGDVLLHRAFRDSMCTYVAEDRFLQIHMIALRDQARAIRLGAFHIFKLFVANPKKPHNVRSILYRNRDRLVKLLRGFSEDGKGDAIMAKDLSSVIRMLEALEAPQTKRAIS